MLGENWTGDREGWTSSGYRRRRLAALLGRHAARGPRRLCWGYVAGGRYLPRNLRDVWARARRGGPRLSRHARCGPRGAGGFLRDPPVGFSAIRLSFEFDADADEKQLAKLRELTERYCVVYQTLACPPALTTTLTSG